MRLRRTNVDKAIGFTGTKDGMSDLQKSQLLRLLTGMKENGYIEFHHGDCIGADAEAHDIARQLGYRIVKHPPTLTGYQAFKQADESRLTYPYLERNRHIVQSTGFLIAAPKSDGETIRSGTWMTVRFARSIGRQIVLLKR
jgi:hypothetical protein